jgi:hypothetical protein
MQTFYRRKALSKALSLSRNGCSEPISAHSGIGAFCLNPARRTRMCKGPQPLKMSHLSHEFQARRRLRIAAEVAYSMDKDARSGTKSTARHAQTSSVRHRVRRPSSHRHQHSADTFSCGWADARRLHDLPHCAARSPALHPLLRSAGSCPYYASHSFQRTATPRTPLLLQPLEQTPA